MQQNNNEIKKKFWISYISLIFSLFIFIYIRHELRIVKQNIQNELIKDLIDFFVINIISYVTYNLLYKYINKK